MPKIYLLSDRNPVPSEVKEMLNRDLKGKHNLVSIGAKREYEKNDNYFFGNKNKAGVIETFKSFSDLENFNLLDYIISKEEGLELLKKADIIYLQGGDQFQQFRYIRDNEYDKFLKNYNGIILGLSAGAMNLAKKAFFSGYDDYYPSAIMYSGFGLIDITVDPHFDIDNEERVKEVKKASFQQKIIGLPNGSAIVIEEDGSIKNIGINYIYENGQEK